MGCATSQPKGKGSDLKKPLVNQPTQQSTKPNNNQNGNSKIQSSQIQKKSQSSKIFTQKQIQQKRRYLISALDEGDISTVPCYIPFQFDPIVTQ